MQISFAFSFILKVSVASPSFDACVHIGPKNNVWKGNCSQIEGNIIVSRTPSSVAFSGGSCLASVSQAGWLRTTVINPIMDLVLQWNPHHSISPVIIGSNSGGSIFMTRYLVLSRRKGAFTYPCYLLSQPYKSVCYFHASFGDVAGWCFSETMYVTAQAVSLTYGSIITNYGGPMGVAALFTSTWFSSLEGLPNKAAALPMSSWARKYASFSEQVPASWVTAHTLVSPRQAGQAPFNYGFDSYLSRGFATVDHSQQQPEATRQNVSVVVVVMASANFQGGTVMLPFSLSGHNWGITTGSSQMKLLGMVVSYMMVDKLIQQHTLLAWESGAGKSFPILDGGFSDNTALTPVLQVTTTMSDRMRPGTVISIGAANTFQTVQFLMGTGAMSIVGLQVNQCPFAEVQICSVVRSITEMGSQLLRGEEFASYQSLKSAYSMLKPSAQILSPFCRDPLSFDLFKGQCSADGACDMWMAVVPNRLNKIQFTPDLYVVNFLMIYLAPSPVAQRFVNSNLPEDFFKLKYFEQMESWFPDFQLDAHGKGGTGFNFPAGNAFMDFMTYLSIRLSGYLLNVNRLSSKPAENTVCRFEQYRAIESQNFKPNALEKV